MIYEPKSGHDKQSMEKTHQPGFLVLFNFNHRYYNIK